MARQKLIETFQKDWNTKAPIKKMPLNESTRIVEKNGQRYEALGAYKVPVWRLDERNLNERVYSTKLAEQVVRDNKTTYACDSHLDEPKFEDVKAIGKNPTIENGILWSECYMVDEEFNKKVERIIEAGAGVGLSSSAWGDQDSDGNILTEGFEIDRYFDFVLDPSYEVYLTKDTKLGESEQNSNEKISEKTEPKKEVKTMDTKKLSLEEKNLKLGVQSLIEKAEKQESVKDKISAYRDVIDYCDGIDSEFAQAFTESAETAISELEESLFENVSKVQEAEQEIQEKGKTLEEKTSLLTEAEQKLTEMQEKYEVALGMVDDFTVRENKLKEMVEVLKAEKNGMVNANDYAEMSAYIQSLEEEMDKLKREVRTLKVENRGLKEENTELHVVASDYQDTNRSLSRKQRMERIARMKAMREEEDADDDEEKDDDEKEEGGYKKKTKESYYNLPGYEDFQYNSLIGNDDTFRDVEGVSAYYEDLEVKDPEVRRIKEEIMRCKTVLEAQRTYMNLYDLLVDKASKPAIRKTESLNKPKKKVHTEPSVRSVLKKGWV